MKLLRGILRQVRRKVLPYEFPYLRGDSNKEYHAFLRRVAAMDAEKAELRAKAKEEDARMLEEAAEDALGEEEKHERLVAARAARASAKEWRKGLGKMVGGTDSDSGGSDGE